MRKSILILFLIFCGIKSYGQSQLFFQNFSSSTNLRSYVGSGNNQFTVISNFRNSSASIENQALSFSKTGSSSSFFILNYQKSGAVKLSFEIDLKVIQPMALNESHRGTILLGGGSDEAWTESSPKQPQNENIHTRTMFNVAYAEDGTPLYSFANSQTTFSGKKQLTFISNNTGQMLKYVGPNNKENTVKDRGYDLWVGNELIMNDATAIGKQTSLEHLKFVYPPNAPNGQIVFSNIKVESLGGESKPAEAVQAISSDPNVLWSWQFTFPAESKGRETAFPATYAKDGLGEALLLRGHNAAPGSGSVRGFTGDFPIDGNLSHAKKSGSYYEFALNIGKGRQVELDAIDVTLRRQQESPYIYRWAYSLDGKKFVDIGDKDIEITSVENLGVKQPTLDLTSIADLRAVKGKVFFRIYTWGGISVAGSQRSFGFGKSDAKGSEMIIFRGKIK